ncbi:MAG: EthD domain-containing protein [Novosphingobium sp.]|nr:EthD domain-containing protein [Novosphingobium sp.]
MQKRQLGTSYRDFQRLWRSHGDFAASVPAFWDNVERYVHNDPLEDLTGLPGVTDEYDAVGELYYTSFETWVSMRDVMLNGIAPDEKRVFAGAPVSVRGQRTTYQPLRGLFKLFTLASFRDEAARANAQALLDEHAAVTLGLEGFGGRLAGFTVTRAREADPSVGVSGVAHMSSSRDLMFVHHFDDADLAHKAMNSADYARLELAQDKLFDWDSRIVVMTRGWVLKGENA